MDDGLKNYLIGNAVMGNAANEMRRTREDYLRRSAHQRKDEELSTTVAKFLLSDDAEGALEYLNESFMDEVIDDCRHQADRNYSMETILVKRKAKYLPYYERIGKPMPVKLANLTADELCAMLGVTGSGGSCWHCLWLEWWFISSGFIDSVCATISTVYV